MAATVKPKVSEKSGRFRWPMSGPGRRLAIGVALGFIALIGVTIWRMRSLDGLPDVGDPFDVAEARRPVEIAPADNAFVAYAEASKLLGPWSPMDDAPRDQLLDAFGGDEKKPLTWSSAPRGLREYLEAKRAALEIWREGSRRRDALYHQPSEASMGSVMNLIDDAKLFAAMAALEGSRLEEAGAGMKPGTGIWRCFDAAASSAGTGRSFNAGTARGSMPWPLAVSCDGRPTRASAPDRSAGHCKTPWLPML